MDPLDTRHRPDFAAALGTGQQSATSLVTAAHACYALSLTVFAPTLAMIIHLDLAPLGDCRRHQD
jgi:hypothetical protein